MNIHDFSIYIIIKTINTEIAEGATLERGLYLLERKEINLKRLNYDRSVRKSEKCDIELQ